MSFNKCIEFEKLLDPDYIMQIINKLIKNLHCIKSDCNHEPTMVYISEGLNQIYCEYHANLTDYQTIPLIFKDELEIHESLLNASERNLLFTQNQMASIKSENCSITPNSSRIEKMEKLESTFTNLKKTLNNLLDKVENIFKNGKSETTTRSDTNNYVSLDYIRDKWKRWDRFCSEIDSIISEIQKDKQVDQIIQTLVDSQKENARFEEEFKCCSYTKVPSEIYGKKYEVLNTSFQSAILIKKVWG